MNEKSNFKLSDESVQKLCKNITDSRELAKTIIKGIRKNKKDSLETLKIIIDAFKGVDYIDNLLSIKPTQTIIDAIEYVLTHFKTEVNDGIKLELVATKEQLEKENTEQKELIIEGYELSLTQKQIEYLYNQIADLLFYNCSLDNWFAIFSVAPKPIAVKKGKKRLLGYFIKKFCPDTEKPWKKAKIIFDTHGLAQSLTTNPYPKGYEKIDAAYNKLLND